MNSINNILQKLQEARTDEDYEAMKAEMKENATYKKIDSICEKYGYSLYTAFIRGEDVRMEIHTKNDSRYLPAVYISRYDGMHPEFTIQTASFGYLDIEEHSQYIKDQVTANNMVKELSDIDLSTLYVYRG